MRSIAFALLLSGAVASAWAAPTASGPWFDPANADRYAFIGKDVWDVATGKLIAAGKAPILYQDSRPVAGTTDRLWLPPTEQGPPGLPAEGMLYSTIDDYQRVHPTLDGKPYTSLGDFPGFWIDNSLRRAVWIDKGDFWRGAVDWNTHMVVDRKQVTHLGVFVGKSPLLWSGDVLLVNGGFDPKKPVVRVDLNSGATEEIETFNVFDTAGAFYANGAGSACCVVRPTAQTLYTYDVRTGKAGSIHNLLFQNPNSSLTDLTDGKIPPVWLDDETVVFVNQAIVTKVDLRKQEMQVLFSPGPPGADLYQFKFVLPGNRYCDIEQRTAIAANAPQAGDNHVFKERFLIDLATGKKITTTLDDDSNGGMWLDDSKFAFLRKTGGLSGVGTWLYDRRTNSSKRIAPTQLETTRMRLLRGGNDIWAVNTAGGTTLWRAKVDGSGAEDLGPSQMFAPVQFPAGPPLDLGLKAIPTPVAAMPTPPAALAPAAAPVAPKPMVPAAAVQPTASTAPPSTPYAVCWGRQGPAHTVYVGAPFAVRAMDVSGWSAAYKQFLSDKYNFVGVIQCATSQSLDASQQRAQQTMDTLRVHWTIVTTDWRFD